MIPKITAQATMAWVAGTSTPINNYAIYHYTGPICFVHIKGCAPVSEGAPRDARSLRSAGSVDRLTHMTVCLYGGSVKRLNFTD